MHHQAHLSLLYRSLVIHLRRQVISVWVSKKQTTDDATFLQPNNSADKIRWSTEEMQPDKGLEMTVALRETAAGQGVPGIFRALATFNFIYQ